MVVESSQLPTTMNSNQIYDGDSMGASVVDISAGQQGMERQHSELRGKGKAIMNDYVDRLHLPAKVHNFVWRALSSCLPTRTILRIRRVEVPEWCPFCHDDLEKDFHILITCPLARNVWSLTSIGSQVGLVGSFVGWWNSLVTNNSLMEVEIAAVILWSIWQNRNDVWNQKSRTATIIFQTALDIRSQWQAAHNISLNSPATFIQLNILRWTRPPEHFLKCNVDVAIFSMSGHAGYGCIIRNHLGSDLGAIHGILPCIRNPSVAKALGIREALSWIKDLAISHVIIESDALSIVHGLNSSILDSSSAGFILEDCKIQALDLQSLFFVFVRRLANHAAHVLARAAVSLSDLEGRVYIQPSVFLQDLV